jgi:hypothetical protein
MTRTVEEAAKALFRTLDNSGLVLEGRDENAILAALREARDAALHEAARHVRKHETGGGWHNVLASEIAALASSPPPAERGLTNGKCGSCGQTVPLWLGDHQHPEGWPCFGSGCLPSAAPARDDLAVLCAIGSDLGIDVDETDPLVPTRHRKALDLIADLRAPAQETETRCEHPAAAVTEYRDGHKRCSACAALWYGDENGGWRSEGKEAPAPAPSAATDTGKDGSR